MSPDTTTGPDSTGGNPPDPPVTPRRRPLKWLALGGALLIFGTAAAASIAYLKVDGNIRTDESTAVSLAENKAERPKSAPERTKNILIMGSDRRSEHGSERSDTVMLLHLSDRENRAQMVSVPRDLMVQIPRCRSRGGGHSTAQRAQFNWAFQFGGAACTIRTFEKLTDIRIDHYMVIDFKGFKKVVNAVGGVEVNLPKSERDPNVGLDLPAGRHVFRGDDALAYVRARSYVGNGSDTNRISRQQGFLSLLAKKMRNDGTLTSPTRLYPVLDAATSSLTADSGLDSLNALYGLVKDVQAIPADRLTFLTVPIRPDPDDPNRLVLQRLPASKLFKALREDRPLPKESTVAAGQERS